MSYRRNDAFLSASEGYYHADYGRKCCDPYDCRGTHHKPGKNDPSNRPEEEGSEYEVCKDRNTPETIIDVLCSFINDQIEVTTPFGVVTGTLLDVNRNYIVLLENNGDQVLVRTEKVESVSPMT